ncbi:MAG: hypothetical protein KDA24_03385 [Deltaproteobacteria bacterium]|nr:hypothetical protein [Deltaproteobacteria bacterium]
MTTRALLLLPALAALALAGCPVTPADDDDSTPDIPDVPEVVNTEWIGDLVGTITYEKTFTSGDLEGTSCTEVFNVNGSPLSVTPQECVACDIVHQVFVTRVEDCAGDDDLADAGQAGFDLRQVEGDAVMWWFQEGGWFSDDEWTELGTGTLEQDFDTSVLDFVYSWDDPQNGGFTGNSHFDFGAGCSPCRFEGTYMMDFDFEFVLPDDWYEQQTGGE